MFIKSRKTGYIYKVIAIDYRNGMYKINNEYGWDDREWWPIDRFIIVEDTEPFIIENDIMKENRILKQEIKTLTEIGQKLKDKIKELEEAQPHE